AVGGAIVGLDNAEQAMHAQHTAGHAGGGIHGRHLGGLLTAGGGGILLDDRAATGEVALGADALGLGRRLFGKAVLLEAARPLAGARRLGAVLPHVHADFFLLRHPSLPPPGDRVHSLYPILPRGAAASLPLSKDHAGYDEKSCNLQWAGTAP